MLERMYTSESMRFLLKRAVPYTVVSSLLRLGCREICAIVVSLRVPRLRMVVDFDRVKTGIICDTAAAVSDAVKVFIRIRHIIDECRPTSVVGIVTVIKLRNYDACTVYRSADCWVWLMLLLYAIPLLLLLPLLMLMPMRRLDVVCAVTLLALIYRVWCGPSPAGPTLCVLQLLQPCSGRVDESIVTVLDTCDRLVIERVSPFVAIVIATITLFVLMRL